MAYAIYLKATGQIIRTCNCTEDQLVDQFDIDSEAAIPGAWPGHEYYVYSGAARAFPTQAQGSTQWSWEKLAWVDARSLAQARAQQWAAIKAERSRREVGQITVAGNTYDLNESKLAGGTLAAFMAKLAGQAWLQSWVLADNTVAVLSADQMIEVGQAAKAQVAALWATSQALREKIEAATTVADVSTITWPG